MNKKINSVPSAETKDEVSANVEVTTSSPNNAKPHVSCSLSSTKFEYELLSSELCKCSFSNKLLNAIGIDKKYPLSCNKSIYRVSRI